MRTGKPRKRVCCCCIIKQKKPKSIFGTVDETFPTDFIDVKVPEDFDSPQSRHIIVENEVDWHSRDSDEENDNYVIDDAVNVFFRVVHYVLLVHVMKFKNGITPPKTSQLQSSVSK